MLRTAGFPRAPSVPTQQQLRPPSCAGAIPFGTAPAPKCINPLPDGTDGAGVDPVPTIKEKFSALDSDSVLKMVGCVLTWDTHLADNTVVDHCFGPCLYVMRLEYASNVADSKANMQVEFLIQLREKEKLPGVVRLGTEGLDLEGTVIVPTGSERVVSLTWNNSVVAGGVIVSTQPTILPPNMKLSTTDVTEAQGTISISFDPDTSQSGEVFPIGVYVQNEDNFVTFQQVQFRVSEDVNLLDAVGHIKARDGELSLLFRLLNLPGQAGMKEDLLSWLGNNDNAGTLFAPSDAALNAFLLSVVGLAPTLAKLDRPEVRAFTSNLLKLHLVPQNIYSEGNAGTGVQYPGPGGNQTLPSLLKP